jgi:hypothetical protein
MTIIHVDSRRKRPQEPYTQRCHSWSPAANKMDYRLHRSLPLALNIAVIIAIVQ